MSDNNIAILDDTNVCHHCLKTSDVTAIHIHELGWGSGFDGWSTKIHLCKECLEMTNPEWWELRVIIGERDIEGHWYEYEDDIFAYIHSLPLAGQELVLNRHASGWSCHNPWDAQDWIDYELKILPHDKCKQYGCYSHQEIDAYHERFPKCQHPVNKIYNDGSSGCWCPYGAHGKAGQLADINCSDECYLCEHYVERTTPIRAILHSDWNDYRTYARMKLEEDRLKEKFEGKDDDWVERLVHKL